MDRGRERERERQRVREIKRERERVREIKRARMKQVDRQTDRQTEISKKRYTEKEKEGWILDFSIFADDSNLYFYSGSFQNSDLKLNLKIYKLYVQYIEKYMYTWINKQIYIILISINIFRGIYIC